VYTFKEYVSRSIDSLRTTFSSKDQTIEVPVPPVEIHLDFQIPPLNEDDVRELAYRKWEQAGCPCGDGREFWIAAEQELNSPLVENLLQY